MKVLQIGKQSFKEIYQSKILFITIFLGAILLLATFVISEFSYGVADKVTLDIGLGLLSISGVIIALFLGSRLLSSEIESRTLYMVLSRPVARAEFLLGKVLGLSGILLVNILVLFLLLVMLLQVLDGSLSPLLLWSVFFIYIESLLVMLMVVFFSLVSNTALSLLMTVTLFVAGHGIDSVRDTSLYKFNESLRTIVDIYSQWMPNFNVLNIKSYVLYESFIPSDWLFKASVYSFFWCLFFFVLAIVIFNKKELT